MKEDNKKEIRKDVLAGAATVAGTAVGAVVENALRAESAVADDTVDAEVVAAVAAEAPVEHEEATPTYAAAPVELDEVVVVAQAPAHAAPGHTVAQHAESEQPIMAAAVSPAPAQSEDIFDDIVVVSQGSEPHTDAFTVQAPPTAAAAPEIIGAEATHEPLVAAATGPMGVPDYMAEDFAEKADSFSSAITDIDSIDMPDYINNANIDSFTEPV